MERITLCNNSVDAITILVVDDDTTCLSIVAAILKKFRYEVVTVKHPNDALCTLRVKEFDLVVSDVHMPDMNGFELQQAIAEEFNLPVVLMSADDEEGVALKGLEKGAAFFILKPVCPDDLKDLWQFATMKKTNSPSVVIEETLTEKNSAGESATSVNETDQILVVSTKDSKRKSPQKEEGSDEKNGDNSQSASTKKPKVIWTNSLHNRFLEAIRSIGLDRAVPKKILEVMNVPGLTRENVASHLQKYRIFLRRVSDASYKIQYSPDNGLSRNVRAIGESSSRITSPPSTLISKFNLNNQFGTSDNSYSFTNLETRNITPHSGIGQSRLLNSNRGWSWPPNTGILQNRLAQNDYHTPRTTTPLSSITLEDVLFDTNFPASNTTYDHAPIISQNNELNSFKTTNYVGYSLSSIQKLTGFRHSEKKVDEVGFNSTSLGGINQIQMPNEVNNVLGTADGLLGDMINNCSSGQVLQVQGQELSCDDYGVMMNTCGVENATAGGVDPLQFESCFTPIFDISELDIMMPNAHQQPLEIEEDFCATFFPNDQLNNQNDLPQQKVGSEASTNSNFYGDLSQWDNPLLSFDPSENQNLNSQASLMSTQGFGSTSHLSDTTFSQINTHQNSQGGLMCSQGFDNSSLLRETTLPPINTHQNSQGGLMCSQEFGNSSHPLIETVAPSINKAQVYEELSSPPAFCTSSQLMTKTVQPLTERDDDEFLESLLAPFGEDQTLAGLI